jgi:hypothetical protein
MSVSWWLLVSFNFVHREIPHSVHKRKLCKSVIMFIYSPIKQDPFLFFTVSGMSISPLEIFSLTYSVNLSILEFTCNVPKWNPKPPKHSKKWRCLVVLILNLVFLSPYISELQEKYNSIGTNVWKIFLFK